MADYIKREDAVIKAKQAVFATFRYGKTPTENAVYENIDIAFKEQYLPSADVVEVKHGKWIEQEDGFGDTYYDCSCCGESFCLIEGTPADNMYNFCPNCGSYNGGKDGT